MGLSAAVNGDAARGDRGALRAPVIATGGLLLVSALPRVSEVPALAGSFWLASLGLLAWTAVLFIQAGRDRRTLRMEVVLRKPHYVQAIVQLVLFAVWGWYWREVYGHAWLIVGQLFFAYAVEALLCWSRRDTWRLGFSPFPIIFSTNLFLWFRDEWFLLQFALVLLGFLGKELITWQKDGRRAHIFNPSAFSLFVFSVALIVTDTTSTTWAQEIATTLNYPPQIYLVLFLLGLVVQGFFAVTLTTLGAAATLYVLNVAYTQATGVYWFVDSNIPIAVFLGLHLLVTDPATSPRSDLGRVIFGGLYGAGVFALYGLLDHIGAPTFYDKLLCVPFLNLAVQRIDRFARSAALERRRVTTLGLAPDSTRRNLVHMGAWMALFAWMQFSGFVGDSHAGARSSFWRTACEQDLRNGCKRLVRLYLNNCKAGAIGSCNEFGVLMADGGLLPRNPELAYAAFARACELGSEPGCVNAGIHYLYRQPPEERAESPLDVVARLAEHCESGSARSCQLVGYAHESGAVGDVDAIRAESMYRESCDGGWADACRGAARLRLDGRLLPVDADAAAGALATGCGLDDAASCRALAQLHHEGRVDGADDDLAITLVRRACALGDPSSCRLAAEASQD